MIGLSFAAAATSTIGIATGVLPLPEHNPVIMAKQAASLDSLSGGRLDARRGRRLVPRRVRRSRRPVRAADPPRSGYVNAMRTIWREDVATFAGSSSSFTDIRVYPKPPRDRQLPVVLGGNSDPALDRVAAFGNGWYGFALDGVAASPNACRTLRTRCDDVGRDITDLQLAVALRDPAPGDPGALAELGVDELVIVETPPDNPRLAAEWVSQLADRWVAAAR